MGYNTGKEKEKYQVTEFDIELDTDDKWYYMDEEGRMATNPVVLTPDHDGSLHYPGLVK